MSGQRRPEPGLRRGGARDAPDRPERPAGARAPAGTGESPMRTPASCGARRLHGRAVRPRRSATAAVTAQPTAAAPPAAAAPRRGGGAVVAAPLGARPGRDGLRAPSSTSRRTAPTRIRPGSRTSRVAGQQLPVRHAHGRTATPRPTGSARRSGACAPAATTSSCSRARPGASRTRCSSPSTLKATTRFSHIMQTKAPGTGTNPMVDHVAAPGAATCPSSNSRPPTSGVTRRLGQPGPAAEPVDRHRAGDDDRRRAERRAAVGGPQRRDDGHRRDPRRAWTTG